MGAPWSHLEGLRVSQALAVRDGEQDRAFWDSQGRLLNSFNKHQTWTARVRRCPPRWLQWIRGCRAVSVPRG